MKDWLKGGLIGAGLAIIVRLLLESGDYYIISLLFYFPVRLISLVYFLNYDFSYILLLADLIGYFIWFIVGVVIGLVVSKIRK